MGKGQDGKTSRGRGQGHPVDAHVGARIKKRRQDLGLSQEVLGNHVHLTFQQIQKYERGLNRVGSSRLYELAQVLNVSVDYFFMGLDGGPDFSEGSEKAGHISQEVENAKAVFGEAEIFNLVENYYKIRSPKCRNAIYIMIKKISEI